MDYLELSIEDLEKKCYKWARDIKKEFRPDIVIYVAKAGYLIGKVFSKVFHSPLIGIQAVRNGNKLKLVLRPVLRLIPNFIRNWIILKELKSNIHNKNSDRNISFIQGITEYNELKKYSILIVDDSVDTGYTIKEVKVKVQKHFKNSEIKIASLNVWKQSEKLIHTDYSLFRNTIIKAPMSKDSKYYNKFIKNFEAENPFISQ